MVTTGRRGSRALQNGAHTAYAASHDGEPGQAADAQGPNGAGTLAGQSSAAHRRASQGASGTGTGNLRPLLAAARGCGTQSPRPVRTAIGLRAVDHNNVLSRHRSGVGHLASPHLALTMPVDTPSAPVPAPAARPWAGDLASRGSPPAPAHVSLPYLSLCPFTRPAQLRHASHDNRHVSIYPPILRVGKWFLLLRVAARPILCAFLIIA